MLEFRIIELDHLTEEEQRERKIIGPKDSFIRKKSCVSECDNEYTMREEAKITQNLCCKCHVIVTMRREKGGNQYYGKILAKKNYVNSLKRKSGCEICGFLDENLLRYLEMDHIDPKQKINKIADMVQYGYSLEELIEECKKCRVLCRFCHKIHTSEQRKQGIS